jgi:hypothetical protein
MKTGLGIQIPLLSSLSKEKKIRVETLSESGAWFRKNFPVTPPTAVTALTDHKNQGKKTVWYNSRYYRVNLLWEGSSFRFRDIHVFNEGMESDYLRIAGTTTDCLYTTLPVVDGFLWSKPDALAGLRLMSKDRAGVVAEVKGGVPVVKEMENGVLMVEWPLENESGTLLLLFFEDRMEVSCRLPKGYTWFLDLKTASGAELPFTGVTDKQLSASLRGFEYSVSCNTGNLVDGRGDASNAFAWRIVPEGNRIVVGMMQ